MRSRHAATYTTRAGRRHRDEAAGVFAFGFEEILIAIETGHRRNVVVRPRWLQRRAPSDEPGGDRDGTAGVSEVVLAVAERPLAVFPRFAPMNGRQRDEQ